MPLAEQSLDAFRVIAEILADLRHAFYRRLKSAHGQSWYRDGIPDQLFERLVSRKETEKSIDWYNNEYQELIDFSTFEDLLGMFEANQEIMDFLKPLAPNSQMLHVRFLELEALRNKVALARTVSDSELAFLLTFQQRLRKSIDARSTDHTQPVRTVPEADEAEKPKSSKKTDPISENHAEPQQQVEPDPEPEPEPEEERVEVEVSETTPEPEPEPESQPEPAAPVRPSAPKPPRPPKAAQPSAARTHESDSQAEEEPSDGRRPSSRSTKTVQKALAEGDTQQILKSLYSEVTAIAEKLASDESTPNPSVWETVREDDWYTSSFSRLGLQPLSEFYGIVNQAQELKEANADKKKMQDFLRDKNFAKTLLGMRDMFQRCWKE